MVNEPKEGSTKELKVGIKNNIPKRLPLTSDYVFKRVFAKEENNSMLKDLLEAILDRKINKVVVKNPEMPKNLADEKLGVLDLKLEVDEQNVIDVEMQMKNEHNIEKRSVFYLSKMMAEQLHKGQQCREMKKGITINLLNFNFWERNSYHSIAHMKFEKSTDIEFVDLGYTKEDEIATDLFEMHFIELPKFKKKDPEASSKLEQWLWLLAGESEEKIKMAVEKNEEVKKTVEVLDELSQNEQERYLYESRLMAEISYNSNIAYAREEGEQLGIAKGKEIGRCEGEKKKSLEIAKKLLEKGMKKEEIAKIVQLDVNELNSI